MLERLYRMLVKEFIQVLRNPRMRAVLFGMPLVQVLVIGYAVSTDVRHVALAVYDLDRTPATRDLLARFEGSGCFDIVKRIGSEAEIQDVLDSGEAKAVLRLNRGFAEDLSGGRGARAQLLLDGSDSNTASVVMSYASRLSADYNRAIMEQRFSRTAGLRLEAEPIALVSRAWFNTNLDSRNFFVPGVLAMLVAILTVILSSMSIVREREIGTMEQIMVTPIGRLEFILGKTTPFAVIGLVDVALIALLAVFWFQIPLAGNPLFLFLGTGLYLMSTLGAGLFISTVSSTQQQAMMTAFFFLLPVFMLSGFVYPIANMPEAVQWLTLLNPLRHYLVIIRGVFLKGLGPSVLWPQMLALAGLGSGMLILAAGRFRKTMV
ncbi:transport permease protein [Geothrix limicola]|uniref:Transport permease protein n=1 Tax=Geothrix limicola TaxID=2927978 RepID=A0ABQ5QCD6_9BACT|nr:ABC transporter permease [Geothrix limicola]GLH72487.1 transport permease protein [Geothrix limicola]